MKGMSLRRDKHILKLRRSVDHFLRVRASGFDLQAVLACVLDCGLHHVFANALAAKLFIDLCMIDRHYAVVRYVGQLGDPFAVLLDIKRTFPPVFVSLNLHHASITTNERPHFHRFVREIA